jgi:hypothetical protein
MFCVVVVASSPGADIAFNVNLNQTTYESYRNVNGIADNWYYSAWDGRPCIVYVYYERWYTRYVYVGDGVVLHVEQ